MTQKTSPHKNYRILKKLGRLLTGFPKVLKPLKKKKNGRPQKQWNDCSDASLSLL
jgi:hypothetical protein